MGIYGTTGVRYGSQSTSVVQLIENDQCTDLQGIEARCKYVRWHHKISKCNKHVDVTCVPTRARTRGTCNEWCAQRGLGYICLRAKTMMGMARPIKPTSASQRRTTDVINIGETKYAN